MKIQRVLSIISVGALLAAGASAESFDSGLASPDTTPVGVNNQSWYNGSGNPQGGFTVDSENGVELGLRAVLRQGAEIDSLTNTYYVPSGPQPTSPSHAAWNYDFSIDLQPGGAGSGLTLGDITALLTVKDLTPGDLQTVTVNALTHWTDDEGFGNSALLTQGALGGQHNPATDADYSAQNSQNPIFGSFPLTGYDEGAGDTYEFDLTVTNTATGALLASDSIDVVVTPEPSTFVLLGAGCLALFLFRRRLLNA